jgi:hypothetical protein
MSVSKSNPVSKTGYKTAYTKQPEKVAKQQAARERQIVQQRQADDAKAARGVKRHRAEIQKRIKQKQTDAPKGYSG